ncbi:hypothetical protein Golomagni_00760 [Golovinomyces magnicellulatus]|nr:hypothetical protein Golomagni_00760 [Golovinomyces magnicellulatus]
MGKEKEDVKEEFNIENTTDIRTIKIVLRFILEQFRKTLETQPDATTEAMREFGNLIMALSTDLKGKSPAQDVPECVEQNLFVKNPSGKIQPKEETTTVDEDKYLSSLSAIVMRLEAKIDNSEATRPNGLSSIKKLVPDNMPGPRRPNNLLNCQDLRVEDLSGADTSNFEKYLSHQLS